MRCKRDGERWSSLNQYRHNGSINYIICFQHFRYDSMENLTAKDDDDEDDKQARRI